jgi:uracil-xanthine permease
VAGRDSAGGPAAPAGPAAGSGWRLHGDGRSVQPGAVVAPEERLSWSRTVGIGLQHVVAMAGSTILVPAITGFPASTTLFFSAVGTALFLLLTRNRLPSYLGSSFAFIAPILAAVASGGPSVATGGVLVTGVLLAVVGLVVHRAGTRWLERAMPPVVTGSVVALIGLNLAPAAWGSCDPVVVDGAIGQGPCSGFRSDPLTGVVTLAVVVLASVLFRGMLGRLSILLGVVVGYLFALARGGVDLTGVRSAAWVGLPDFTAPAFDVSAIVLFLPVVLVLVAENVGHVKSVAAMTGRDLDALTGRALVADGVATTLAGAGGGSGTTTYAENIGVMAATRIYSTAAYWVAAAAALVLSASPKVGALVASVPDGVLGGAATLLYGMIGVLGARIWVNNRVDFSNPVNLTPAAVALVVGIANYTWSPGGGLQFSGIALGTAAAIGLYHLMRVVSAARGTAAVPTTPADAAGR